MIVINRTVLAVLCLLLCQAAPAKPPVNKHYKQFTRAFRRLDKRHIAVLSFDCQLAPGERARYFSVDSNGIFAASARHQHVVTAEERRRIKKLFRDPGSYRDRYATGMGCFNPRMGFIFYGSDSGTILARLDVCLECHSLQFQNFKTRYTVDVLIANYGLDQLSSLCADLGLGCCERK